MAIERNSPNLHEITVSVLVELDPDFDPQERAIEIYDTLVQQELVHGLVIERTGPLDFDTAVDRYDPRIWGTHVLCSTACDVTAGCECHGGYTE
jgi:hypothetical protein